MALATYFLAAGFGVLALLLTSAFLPEVSELPRGLLWTMAIFGSIFGTLLAHVMGFDKGGPGIAWESLLVGVPMVPFLALWLSRLREDEPR